MHKHLIALVAAAATLPGCTIQPAAPPVSTVDYDIGIAKSCTASPVDLSAGTTAAATIAMTNDGWCAVRATEKDGKPFALGLLRARPAHGTVEIRSLGGKTRLEYTADSRYAGADRFTVALRSRTPNVPDAVIQVTVDVKMGEGMALPPPPAPAPVRRPAAPARPRS